MIPSAMITEWRTFAPWPESFQVEQDLVLSKALVQIYSDPHLKDTFAFRGGTALQKIFFKTPTRYSEDIDLVQVRKEPIGDSVNAMRRILDPWLGKPRIERGNARFTLKYRFQSEEPPKIPMRLKIEINNGEHFSVLGHKNTKFEMQSAWFAGSCEILMLRPGTAKFDAKTEGELLKQRTLSLLPGDPWKGIQAKDKKPKS